MDQLVDSGPTAIIAGPNTPLIGPWALANVPWVHAWIFGPQAVVQLASAVLC